MNPYTKNSAIIGDITKIAIELRDRQALIELLTAARKAQRRLRLRADAEKGTARRQCSAQGCSEQGIVTVEDGEWLCARHATERINSPENVELTEADAELQDLRDKGSQPS